MGGGNAVVMLGGRQEIPLRPLHWRHAAIAAGATSPAQTNRLDQIATRCGDVGDRLSAQYSRQAARSSDESRRIARCVAGAPDLPVRRDIRFPLRIAATATGAARQSATGAPDPKQAATSAATAGARRAAEGTWSDPSRQYGADSACHT